MKLKELQYWFGTLIRSPLDHNSISQITPFNTPVEEEAALHILPSAHLKPHERLEIYNQQYWWRLLKIMQDHFPLLVRLFGTAGFNHAISVPYLYKHPPNHWNINTLGSSLVQWIDADYHEDDRLLIKRCAQIDWAFIESFIAKNTDPLTPEGDVKKYFDIPLYLNPTVNLFSFPSHLFHFRGEVLKQDENWFIKNDFPKLQKDKEYYFLLYRNNVLDIVWVEIDEAQHTLLSCFKDGITLNQLSEKVDNFSSHVRNETLKNLVQWIHQWINRPLLTQEKPLIWPM